MRIAGLQRLTLLDYPGKTACTLFFGGCNYRCPFCHNRDLLEMGARGDNLDPEEVYAFLRKRKTVLDGVCVSGGEPLLQPELPSLLQTIKELGYCVKLDTNGSMPDKLERLIQDGLVDRVAMDIKASEENYALACGVPHVDTAAVQKTAAMLLRGSLPYEFRTTCVRGIHTQGEMERIGRWLEGASQYFLQVFVPSERVLQPGLEPLSPPEMTALRDTLRLFIPHTELRGM